MTRCAPTGPRAFTRRHLVNSFASRAGRFHGRDLHASGHLGRLLRRPGYCTVQCWWPYSRSLPSLQRLPTLPLGSPQLEAHQSVSQCTGLVPESSAVDSVWGTYCTRLHIQLYRSRFVIGLLVRSKPIQILQFDGSISELVEMEQVCETLGTQNLYTSYWATAP